MVFANDNTTNTMFISFGGSSYNNNPGYVEFNYTQVDRVFWYNESNPASSLEIKVANMNYLIDAVEGLVGLSGENALSNASYQYNMAYNTVQNQSFVYSSVSLG